MNASSASLKAEDLKGRSVAATSRGKPDFQAMTAGGAAVASGFGLIGALAESGHMTQVGDRIVQENQIEDPAGYISQKLMEDLTTKLGLVAKEVPGGVTTSERIPDLRQRFGGIDVLLDVRTTNWGFAYFPLDWDHYDATYGVSVRIVDLKTGQVLAEAKAKQTPGRKKIGAPTRDQLLSNKAEVLKQELRTAADLCLATLRASILPREYTMTQDSTEATETLTEASGGEAKSIGYFAAIAADPLPVVGQQYYTRYCIRHDKSSWPTTNYWRGILVPINTRVTVLSFDDKRMELRLPSGETVKIENVEKYSKRNMTNIANNLLTPQPVPIGRFGEATANAISRGLLVVGMTREQVVMAHGYPPGHRTPSLDSDIWMYWTGRSETQTIVFNNGLLSGGQGVSHPVVAQEPPTTAASADTRLPDASSNSTAPEPSASPPSAEPPTPSATVADSHGGDETAEHGSPPSSSRHSFMITGKDFSARADLGGGSDVDILSVDERNGTFGVRARSIGITGGQMVIWDNQAKHTWIGTLSYAGYTFESSESDPLQFQVEKNKGYVYLKGTGKVRTPDQQVIDLPPAATDDRQAPDAAATSGTIDGGVQVTPEETPQTTTATNSRSAKNPGVQPNPVIWLSGDRVVTGMPLHLRVLSGEYTLKQGTTFLAGSDTNIDESGMTFPAGLSIVIGESGVIINNQLLPKGSKWIVDAGGKLAPGEIPAPRAGP